MNINDMIKAAEEAQSKLYNCEYDFTYNDQKELKALVAAMAEELKKGSRDDESGKFISYINGCGASTYRRA